MNIAIDSFLLQTPPAAVLDVAPRVARVLMVDDHELIRCGMRMLYPSVAGVMLDWFEAATLDDALEIYAREDDIDVVLLDLNLADSKGLNGLRSFLQAHPEARVAIFSGTQDEFVMRQARALGAVAYLAKTTSHEFMRDALGTLLWPQRAEASNLTAGDGDRTLFPRLSSNGALDRATDLSPRHLEILELVLEGCTNQEIGRATKLSLGTIKNYVSSLLLALDVKSRSHLISLFR